jgi:hypothetical protein
VRLRSLVHQRPSAPMAVSLVALFMSVGGVGYAAISLPPNSVGSDQIKNEAVTYKKIRPNAVGAVRLANNGVTESKLRNEAVSYRKIRPNAVGKVRANLNQLQARITDACAAGSAIGGVDKTGKPTCAFPAQSAVADKAAAVGATAATVNSLSLATGSSYLVFANPAVTVTGGTGQVTVTCVLTVGTTAQTRSVAVNAPGSASIALQAAGAAGTASVVCAAAGGTGATVSVTSAINALRTA